jgi:hypothetical protein
LRTLLRKDVCYLTVVRYRLGIHVHESGPTFCQFLLIFNNYFSYLIFSLIFQQFFHFLFHFSLNFFYFTSFLLICAFHCYSFHMFFLLITEFSLSPIKNENSLHFCGKICEQENGYCLLLENEHGKMT